jgi:hypothetical protein
MTQYAVGPQVSQVWTGGGPVLFANQDITNTVTVGGTTNVFQDSPAAVPIPPLGSIAVEGYDSWYAIAPAGTTALLVIPGGTSWSPSPADVALQISTLGLAKDTSVLTVNGSVDSLSSPGLTIAQEGQALGTPPFVPSLKSATQIRQSTGVNTFFTFGSAGRIWAVALSYFTTTNNSYSVSTSQTYAAVETQSGLTLGIVELGAADPNQGFSGQSNLTFNGLPLAGGDKLILDVNNGTVVANLNQRASAVVLYSIP